MNMIHACIAAAAAAASAPAPAQDVLLVADGWENRIMAFSPLDGALLDDAFIPNPGEVNGENVLTRAFHAIDSGRQSILVVDQLKGYVVEFGYDGSYQGVFVDRFAAGDPLFFTRGIGLMPDGTLAVCNQGVEIEPIANAVVRFDAQGAHDGFVVRERYGGIDTPTSLVSLDGALLVASDLTDFIARYGADDKFGDIFARHPFIDRPLQMTATGDGHLLVATFGSPGRILDFDAGGTLVDSWRIDFTSGYRGVAELDNGNVLVSCSQGVMEVTRDGTLVEWEFDGDDGVTSFLYYIERVTPPGAVAVGKTARPSPAPPAAERRSKTGPIAASTLANDILVIERTDYRDLPCKQAGTVGSFPAGDPSAVIQLGDAGALHWVGIDMHPVTGERYGFELTTNSVRRIEPGGGNTLLDSVGYVDDNWWGGMAFSNTGSTLYLTATTVSYTRVLEVAFPSIEVLAVHDYFGVLFHGLAVVPPNDLGLPEGALWVTRQGSLVSDMALLELDLATDVANFVEPLLIDSHGDVGLDFAPDGTLYLSANPFSTIYGIAPAVLHEVDPVSLLELPIGTIDQDSCPWDAGSIAVITPPSIACPGDVNLDGEVSAADLLALLVEWGSAAPLADLNGDGIVGPADLLALLAAWGPCVPE